MKFLKQADYIGFVIVKLSKLRCKLPQIPLYKGFFEN